jgi:predicted lipoprotein with Yx(FWY)xxD motif
MRSLPLALAACMFLSPHAAAQQTAASSASKETDHPAEVALVAEGKHGYVYRRFPTGERLYTYDLDPPGVSKCDLGCASAWPPVIAPPDAVPTGDWTIAKRTDGTGQWALNGKPVYTRFHDAPDAPAGDKVRGVWHLVPYMAGPAAP